MQYIYIGINIQEFCDISIHTKCHSIGSFSIKINTKNPCKKKIMSCSLVSLSTNKKNCLLAKTGDNPRYVFWNTKRNI